MGVIARQSLALLILGCGCSSNLHLTENRHLVHSTFQYDSRYLKRGLCILAYQISLTSKHTAITGTIIIIFGFVLGMEKMLNDLHIGQSL